MASVTDYIYVRFLLLLVVQLLWQIYIRTGKHYQIHYSCFRYE